MSLRVRQMKLEEVGLIIDYFHESTAEHLELLGVDPTRLPERVRWREHYANELAEPVENRKSLLVLWELHGKAIGFSTADKIQPGRQANMHLHIVDAGLRTSGLGVQCVIETVRLYFDVLGIERIFCEPNAFNVAPNRTLQKAGFTYVKTHETVPGPLNYHQPVTRWVFEKSSLIPRAIPPEQPS